MRKGQYHTVPFSAFTNRQEVMPVKHFALLGEKLGHSLSVPIHQAIFRHLGLQDTYELLEISRERFPEEAARAMKEYDGLNVTIPYKKDILPLLSSMDPLAEKVGAVNTVLCSQARGYNTDVQGFAYMLRSAAIDPAGEDCYVLGTGGASRAVVTALDTMGAQSVTLVSRTPGPGAISYQELVQCFHGILVNTTPCGMYPRPEGCPLDPELLPRLFRSCRGVADLIYNPRETVLTAAAHACGIPRVTGLSMLVHQAVAAESVWQGRALDDDLTRAILEEGIS